MGQRQASVMMNDQSVTRLARHLRQVRQHHRVGQGSDPACRLGLVPARFGSELPGRSNAAPTGEIFQSAGHIGLLVPDRLAQVEHHERDIGS
jgi:hypothetical protein